MSRFRSLRCPPLRLRYSLRALAIILTLFCLWGGYHANHGWKERRAVSILSEHGARLHWGRAAHYPSGVSAWLDYPKIAYRLLVGYLWGDHRIGTAVVPSPISKQLAAALADLRALDEVQITGVRLSDEEALKVRSGNPPASRGQLPKGGLRQILQNGTVRDLRILAAKVSDDDCRAIAECNSVAALQLIGCELSEDGFAQIVSTGRLFWLEFPSCNVTGDTLAGVPGSARLWDVRSTGTPVGEEFARYIGRCSHIWNLEVGHASLGDSFVAALGPDANVEGLVVYGGGITDLCAEHLLRIRSLRSVLFPAGLNDSTVAQLRARGIYVGPEAYYPQHGARK